jgi:hypothetical protein
VQILICCYKNVILIKDREKPSFNSQLKQTMKRSIERRYAERKRAKEHERIKKLSKLIKGRAGQGTNLYAKGR